MHRLHVLAGWRRTRSMGREWGGLESGGRIDDRNRPRPHAAVLDRVATRQKQASTPRVGKKVDVVVRNAAGGGGTEVNGDLSGPK